MISVEEAKKIILSRRNNFGVELVSLDESIGRILAEDVVADRDFPPYDRVTMDGIAIQHEEGKNEYDIAGVVGAGDPPSRLKATDSCFEVMTGAMLPEGSDTVIRYEDLELKDDKARILVDPGKGRNIHRKGSDHRVGIRILEAGKVISPAEIGVLATVGKSLVKVKKHPAILIISTGNELVEVDQEPAPYQIRRSNVHQLTAILRQHGLSAKMAHLQDDQEIIRESISEFIKKYDVLLLSGAVSKGKFDFLPDALENAGVQKHFHKVRQRPGKPFWFGTTEKCTVFAFPGNPVSSFMCMYYYFIPWLYASMNSSEISVSTARLSEDVEFKPVLTYFLEVRLKYEKDGSLTATPNRGNGSGDLTNLTGAEAFMILPETKETFRKGEVYPVLNYR